MVQNLSNSVCRNYLVDLDGKLHRDRTYWSAEKELYATIQDNFRIVTKVRRVFLEFVQDFLKISNLLKNIQHFTRF